MYTKVFKLTSKALAKVVFGKLRDFNTKRRYGLAHWQKMVVHTQPNGVVLVGGFTGGQERVDNVRVGVRAE